MGGPRNITQGSVADLEIPDAVMVDELYAENKLGVTKVGQVIEINKRRARVVGFTRGVRIFTSQPAVFTSFKNAQSFLGLSEDQSFFLVLRAREGADIEALRSRLAGELKDVEVLTTGQLVYRQGMYWVFGTGAGSRSSSLRCSRS